MGPVVVPRLTGATAGVALATAGDDTAGPDHRPGTETRQGRRARAHGPRASHRHSRSAALGDSYDQVEVTLDGWGGEAHVQLNRDFSVVGSEAVDRATMTTCYRQCWRS